jgi:hypothetical protein
MTPFYLPKNMVRKNSRALKIKSPPEALEATYFDA